jgi:hypothetical protein
VFELRVHGRAHLAPRHAAAVEAFLKNPDLHPRELARIVGATEKQLDRMREVVRLRRLKT